MTLAASIDSELNNLEYTRIELADDMHMAAIAYLSAKPRDHDL